jgi:hypothetical protein
VVHTLYLKIKQHATTLAFIVGFIWDNIMLTRIDHAFANIMLGSYLCISAGCILAMNMSPKEYNWHRKLMEKFTRWLPVILQFCFGSLFSAYIIFYTRSASLATDWPFLLFLVILVISNELFRKRYLSITLPVSIFFTVLFSYNIFSLPTLLGSMGPEVFIASGLLSLLIVYFLTLALGRIAEEKFLESRTALRGSILVIYFLFNLAYFTNAIPPIPLALKEIGVYHSITRSSDGTYSLTFEPSQWYPFFKNPSNIPHKTDNKPIYVWSTVFAPSTLSVPIFHLWQYFDETDKVWVATDLVKFEIKGGREEGYRGYSIKSGVFPGRWRVDVQTERKDIIGRVEFKIVSLREIPPGGNNNPKIIPNLIIEKR